MVRFGRVVATALLVFVFGCGQQQVAMDQPEILLFNGRIFTGATPPYVEALLIRGDRVVATGSTEQLLRDAGSDARRIDLQRRLTIPGINDAHLHIDMFLPVHTQLPFDTTDPRCAIVLERVRETVRTAPKDRPIFGTIGQTALFEDDCSAVMLDRLAPEHAVLLNTWTPHAIILNRTAVNMFAVPTADPPTGGFYGKDQRSTAWDGVIHEYAFFQLFADLAKRVDDERARATLRGVLDEAARFGITSLQPMSMDPARLARLLSDVGTPLRVRIMDFPATDVGRRKAHARTEVSDRVAYGDLKVILDGTPIERSAAMRAEHDDAPGLRGELNFSSEQIRDFLRASRQGDYQLVLHAVGDRTVATILDSLAADEASDWPERRLRIEHGDGVTPDLVSAVRRFGVVVVPNPSHLMLPDLLVRRYGARRTQTMQPLRSLIDSGIPIAFGSDGPLNPFLNLMFATSYPSNPTEAVTLEQALGAYTQGSAFAEFADREKGTLEVGKLADLAVLSQDIFLVPPSALPATVSVLTMVGGRIVYDANALK